MVDLQDVGIDRSRVQASASPGYPTRDGSAASEAQCPAIERLSASGAESTSEALREPHHDATVRHPRTPKKLNVEASTCKPPNGGSSCGPVVVEYLTDERQSETLVFEAAAVEAELASMLGGPITEPLRLESQLRVAPASPLSRAVALMHRELRDADGLATIPAIFTRLERVVMAALLISEPHNYTEALTKPGSVHASKPIRNALEYIEGRPAEIETVADIAAAVGLSVRALDDGFQRYVGVPPMAFLRQVRMTRAHEDLLAANPQVLTATAVAPKWGFGHYGRFAAEYRRRFGRKPSETLRSS